MRKKISRLLVTMFFGFTLTLIISCILLIINSVGVSDGTKLEAVSIDPDSDVSSVYKKIDEVSVEVSEVSQVNGNVDSEYNFGFRSLSDTNEQYLYHKLMRNLYYITDQKSDSGYFKAERITVSRCEMTEDSIRHALNAYIADNPQVFWVSNVFGYAYSDGNTIIECYSVIPADKITELSLILSKKINEMLEDLDTKMDDYHIERYIHDKLLRNCSYAEEIKSVNDGWEYFTSYGAIVNGSAVCEGYSKAMQMLLNLTGIPSYIIRGEAEGVKHMWNLVKVGEEWYHLDSTWNDSDTTISYEYFNLPTNLVEENHIIYSLIGTGGDEADRTGPNFFIPECDSMEMYFYTVDGFTIERFYNETDQNVVAQIVHLVNNGEVYLHINVGSELSYDECIDTLFNAPGHRIYHYIDLANELLDSDHKLSREGMKLLKHEDRGQLRIRLNYNL